MMKRSLRVPVPHWAEILRCMKSQPVLILLALFAAGGVCRAEEMVRSEHFEVVHDGIRKSFAEKISRDIESNYREISHTLRHTMSKKIRVILTRSLEQYHELTEGVLPEWSTAVAVPGGRIIVTPRAGQMSGLAQLLAHETVHIVIDDAAEDTFVPRWFHEGCAQLLSKERGVRDRLYMFWKVARNDLLTFEDIQNVFTARDADASLAYDQSMLAVQHLIAQHGKDVLASIIEGLKGDLGFPTAFRNATDLWPSEFERWYIKEVTRSYGTRSLYVLIPSTWTLIMLLAFAVYLIKKWRNKRLLEQWEIVEAAEKIINFEDYHHHSCDGQNGR